MNLDQLIEKGLVVVCPQCDGNYTSWPPLTRQMCTMCYGSGYRGYVSVDGSFFGYFCVWAEQASLTDACAGARLRDNLPWHESCGLVYIMMVEDA